MQHFFFVFVLAKITILVTFCHSAHSYRVILYPCPASWSTCRKQVTEYVRYLRVWCFR